VKDSFTLPVTGGEDMICLFKEPEKSFLPLVVKPMLLYRVIGNILLYQGAKK